MNSVIYLNKVRLDAHLPAVNFSLFNAYALARAGAETWLVAQADRPDVDETTLLRQFDLTPLPNFHLKIISRQRFLGIRTNQLFYREAFRFIDARMRKNPETAVISRDPGALFYLARRVGVPVYYQPHNFYADLTRRDDVNPKNARKYAFLEKRYVPRMTGILCLQPSQAAWYQRCFPNTPVVATPPGLMNTYPPIGDDPFERRRISYVGSLQIKKGIDVLLTAMASLGAEGFHLALIGGRSAAEIEQARLEIGERQLEGHVTITGWLPFQEVVAHLRRSSVGVLPLRDTFYNRYLTAPNKLFDYFSCGLPIVASDLPAIRDFCGDTGTAVTWVRPDDALALAAGLRDRFQSVEKYAQARQQMRQLAATHRWEQRAKEMLAIMRDLAKSGC